MAISLQQNHIWATLEISKYSIWGMFMKKKIIVGMLLVVVLALGATACQKEHSKKETAKQEVTENPETAGNEETSKKETEQEESEQEIIEEIEDDQEIMEEVEGEREEVEQSTPVVKVEAIPGQHRDPNEIVVVIDPGHQRRGESAKEPNGPGSSVMKARVTSGTTGVSTGVAEYILNLEISLLLKTELENRGYTVYMTRSAHDVQISNKERAEYASSVNADIAVRIHGNGSENRSICGAETYVPSANNPYVSHLAKASYSLGQCLVNEYCKATGFKNRGVFASDTMTGINWSTVPVAILEMGYMSNAEEDRKMQDDVIQNNMVQGIANGIDAYFGL